MSNLPILHVETAHSRYVIDQNEGTYQRTRVHEHAADLSYADVNDGEFVAYSEIYLGPTEGDRMVIGHSDGTVLYSTPVQSVTEAWPVKESA